MLIEIDPKIIEEKLRAEFGPSYLEDMRHSEDISHNICKRGADMGVLNKMREDAIKWLPCQNAYEPDKTNRQVIEIMWARIFVRPAKWYN